MRLLALFLWLALPATAYAVYLSYGTPHFIWSYAFTTSGSPNDVFAERTYNSCTYLGWGWQEVTKPAIAGRCAWVRFFKAGGQ